MKSPFKDRLLLVAFLLLLVVFGVLLARKFFISTPPAQAPVAQQESKQLREVILYFGSEDGARLVPEAREIEDCLQEEDCIRETVQALVNGPIGDLVPILPSHTVVRGVTIEEGTATIDFSRDLIAGHPGGSLSELLTVYGVANTLAVNFPYIRQVRFLIEGEPVETLKGHVGLQEPVKADFNLSRGGEGGANRPGDLTEIPIEEGR